MSNLRNVWVKAKKDIRTKDWEKKVKLKDDLGPTLDEFDSTISKLEKVGLEAFRLHAEAEKIMKKLCVTIAGYDTKIKESAKQDLIMNGEAEDLRSGLMELTKSELPERMQNSINQFTDLSKLCDKLPDIVKNAI
jgi:hypothetical protein